MGITQFSSFFDNNGAVDIQSGELWLSNGGIIAAHLPAPHRLSAPEPVYHTFLEGSEISVSNFLINSGNADVFGAFSVANVTLGPGGGGLNLKSGDPVTLTNLTISGGGRLTGPSDVTVQETFSWAGGALRGSGQTISNGTMDIFSPPGFWR